ncbi:hypothetical protein [Pontibacter sp. SGAir0037]|uniref:hypothetical protein n=1 Tax=Pontibacter sp. SGAir0037 TaxID=2571030 RepID=UPI0010CD2B4B|nr:hypothetical protein [Pontibacter sp. SGAir0037]QCR21839.1 hypothetical protein C1N53_05470 [Pontibacter sp. SGAir0037]
MSRLIFVRLSLALALLVALNSCRTNTVAGKKYPGTVTRTSLPPGQAKKIYGHQSAKAFAPGQQKKKHVQANQANNSKKKKKGKK